MISALREKESPVLIQDIPEEQSFHKPDKQEKLPSPTALSHLHPAPSLSSPPRPLSPLPALARRQRPVGRAALLAHTHRVARRDLLPPNPWRSSGPSPPLAMALVEGR